MLIFILNVRFSQFCVYAAKIKLISEMSQDDQGTWETWKTWETQQEVKETQETRETQPIISQKVALQCRAFAYFFLSFIVIFIGIGLTLRQI